MQSPRVAVLGTGALGEALVSGLLRGGTPAEHLLVTVRRQERAEELRARHGVRVVDTGEAVAGSDVLFVGVKPLDVAPLLAELSPFLDPARHLVVSLAAGLATPFLEDRLPQGTPVVRVITNTPILVGAAVSVLSCGAAATEQHLEVVEQLLRSVGTVHRVPERLQDAAAALSGSGPAYVYYVLEAMTDAGVLLGVPRRLAAELLLEMVTGAAALLRETGLPPVLLREQVTSPGGTTAAALRRLDEHGVRAAFVDALEAARDRSGQVAAQAEGS